MFRLFNAAVVLIMLVSVTVPLYAEGVAASEPTRVELLVTGTADAPKAASSKDDSQVSPEKAMSIAVQRSIKATNSLSSDFPKCHFRIASLVTQPSDHANIALQPQLFPLKQGLGQPGAPQMPVAASFANTSVTLKVVLIGEQGCLSATK